MSFIKIFLLLILSTYIFGAETKYFNNINMQGYKIVNLGNGSSSTDGANYGQLTGYINGLSASTLASGDKFGFYDLSLSGDRSITWGNLEASINLANISGGGSNFVRSTSTFSSDNKVTVSDGTSRNIEVTPVNIDSLGNISLLKNISAETFSMSVSQVLSTGFGGGFGYVNYIQNDFTTTGNVTNTDAHNTFSGLYWNGSHTYTRAVGGYGLGGNFIFFWQQGAGAVDGAHALAPVLLVNSGRTVTEGAALRPFISNAGTCTFCSIVSLEANNYIGTGSFGTINALHVPAGAISGRTATNKYVFNIQDTSPSQMAGSLDVAGDVDAGNIKLSSNAISSISGSLHFDAFDGKIQLNDKLTNSAGDYGFEVDADTSSVNWLYALGSSTGNTLVLGARGSDTNISIEFEPKGSGTIGILGDAVLNSHKITLLANGTASTDGINLGQLTGYINSLSSDTIVSGDKISFRDISGGDDNYTTFANFEAALTLANQIGYSNLAQRITGDINHTSFSGANNQSSPADVTSLAFANGTTRSFEALVSISVDATTDLFESCKLLGVQRSADWGINSSCTGDTSQVAFTITNAGQVQYTSGNYSGFSSLTIKFRAITTSI